MGLGAGHLTRLGAAVGSGRPLRARHPLPQKAERAKNEKGVFDMDGAAQTTTDQIELYWQPGCSGCLRAKEFLRSRGIDYVSINVIDEPERMDAAVARFGLKTLPLGIKGDRCVAAQNLTDLASLIGAGEVVDETPVMSPEELV